MRKKIKKDKNCPLVTIVTPTYNRASFLEETILSVISQDYKNIEYIVLDDGSTDDTYKIIQKYKDKITFKSHKNIGEVRTVNKGFSLSRGEIIGVVNSDDPLLPGAVSEVVKFMVRNPEIIVVYPDWINIDEKGKEIGKSTTLDYDYEYMIRTHNCLIGPGAFFKRVLVDRLKERDAQFTCVSDYDFWLRAGLIGKFARIPKYLATSRVHAGQATFTNRGFGMAMEHIRVINKLFDLPNLPVSVKKIKSDAYNKACEAARICRGDKLSTKILIFLVCLYYAPCSYLEEIVTYRLTRLRKLLHLV